MQGFLKDLCKFIGVYLQYKSSIINQLNIDGFNNKIFFKPKSFWCDMYNNSKWMKYYYHNI